MSTSHDPIYSFQNLSCISCIGDLEGANIFENIAKNIDHDKLFSCTYNNNTLTLKQTQGFICSGDIVDNEDNDIRLLNMLNSLKEENTDRVIYTIGNRDINKIRLCDESFIVFNGSDLPWNNTNHKTLEDLCLDIAKNNNFGKDKTYNWLYDKKPIKEKYVYCQDITKCRQEWTVNDQWFEQTGLDRISTLRRFAYGVSNAHERRYNECKILFKDDLKKLDKHDDNFKYALLAITDMMMCFKWKPHHLIDPRLNGAYIKYLNNSHIIAQFTTKDNKKGYVSHGGIPEYLSSPFGFKPKSKKTTASSIEVILQEIENEKRTLVNCFNTDCHSLESAQSVYNTLRKCKEYYKFIHLSASIGTITVSNDLTIGHMYSPMIVFKSNNLTTHTGIFPSSVGGDTEWQNKNREDIKGISIKDIEYTYNIFGHQPQGFWPSVIRTTSKSSNPSYNICLDISGINRINYVGLGGYTFLNINKMKNDQVIGCIFTEGLDEKTYKFTNSAKLDNTYYEIDIDLFSKSPEQVQELYNSNPPLPELVNTIMLKDGMKYQYRIENMYSWQSLSKVDKSCALSSTDDQCIKKKVEPCQSVSDIPFHQTFNSGVQYVIGIEHVLKGSNFFNYASACKQLQVLDNTSIQCAIISNIPIRILLSNEQYQIIKAIHDLQVHSNSKPRRTITLKSKQESNENFLKYVCQLLLLHDKCVIVNDYESIFTTKDKGPSTPTGAYKYHTGFIVNGLELQHDLNNKNGSPRSANDKILFIDMTLALKYALQENLL